MQSIAPKHLEDRFAKLKVLVVDDDHYMRKVVRTMLTVIGVRQIHEAVDGTSGLNAIREIGPDLVLVDWEMPTIDGMQFVRLVRWPGGACPVPDVPIIMLTGHGDRWRVVEAARLGVHEYLLKPVSTKALLDRLVSIFSNPRPIVKGGGYYGPTPRKVVPILDEKTVAVPRHDVVVLN
jgi:DNA-binding response OmpR family regulator